MPKKPNFSLNLDGCRFGDSPPSFHHRHTTTPQNNDQSQNKNNEIRPANHVNQSYNPNIHNLQFSPPPSQHSNNERKQKNRQQNRFHPMDMMNQIASPLGTTYRAEGLSIGRDFLRFQGSTLSSSFCLDDLIVDECVGRGACSMVLKAKRRKEQVECDHEMGGMNNATHPKTPTPSQQKMQQKQNQKEKTRSNCNGKEEYYALKIFTMRDVEKRNMLLRELKVLCTSFNNCDCLVELEGAFLDREEGTVTLVLEFMDRGSLADLYHCISLNDTTTNSIIDNYNIPTSPVFRGLSPPLKKHKKMPEHAIAAIAYQMIWGLAYLHHENTLHRDIKPANVLVSSSGRVKLADFGIVSQKPQHQQNDDNDDNMNVTVIGTTRYMSPERLRGKAYAMPSDVWSLGLVLLECALGKSPFEDVSSIVELVQTLDDSNMSEFIPPTTSFGLHEILLGCLNHTPEKRMPTSVLISSPWFLSHRIQDIDDAASIMRKYLDHAYPSM